MFVAKTVKTKMKYIAGLCVVIIIISNQFSFYRILLFAHIYNLYEYISDSLIVQTSGTLYSRLARLKPEGLQRWSRGCRFSLGGRADRTTLTLFFSLPSAAPPLTQPKRRDVFPSVIGKQTSFGVGRLLLCLK